MKKKLLSLFTGTLSLFAFLALPAAAQTGFSDVSPSHANYRAIISLQEDGIIGGYPDGTFRPEQSINRVEALKIILLGAAINVPATTAGLNFNDVDSTQWYAPYILKAVNLGIVAGYPDGTFKPTQTVNLVEALKMIANTNGINLESVVVSGDPYADAFADQWYAKYVQYAKNSDWITPNAQNMIFPSQNMTRGKLAQLMYDAKTSIEAMKNEKITQEKEPAVTPSLVQNVTIQNSAFSIQNLTVAVGTTVRWTNKDKSMTHTIASVGNTFTGSASLSKDETYDYTFDQVGTFDYFCSQHPSMTGTITVKPANQVPTI